MVSLLLAVSLDLLCGEPADRCHPVAWIGRALGRAEAGARRRGVADGAAALVLVTGTAAVIAGIAGRVAGRLGRAGVVLEAVVLKPALAVRRLRDAALEVRAALETGDLGEARRLAGRHLVSRPTEGLDVSGVVSATVESVAENLTDSVAAPLLAYAVGGLPGAWAYRVLNTADAMWGYRDGCYERFGKAAARADDAANLGPARLAAGALAAGAVVVGEDGAGACRLAWRDHRPTASPNAGWTMAAMAGALGVRLAKPGAYDLGDGVMPEAPQVITRSLRVFGAATVLVVIAAAGLAACRGWRR